MILAFIEDIANSSKPTRSPAYQQLVAAFDVSSSILKGLVEYVQNSGVLNSFPFFPEDILVRFQLEKLPTFGRKHEAS
jgi:hypothetical protein